MTCFAVGALLFLITLIMNIVGQRIFQSFRSQSPSQERR